MFTTLINLTMKRFFLLFIVLVLTNVDIWAQIDIEQYIKNNAHKVLTDNPDSLNFDDLDQFGAAIGNKRILLLGEQNHGDAATFLVKSRLVKYLHEKKGFNVLAFESDFLSLEHGWGLIQKTKPAIDSFVMRNIFPIWTNCHTTKNLFYNYLYETQNTHSPLQLTGFDCQMHGRYLFNKMQPFLKNLFANTVINEKDFNTLYEYADSLFLDNLNKDEQIFILLEQSLNNIINGVNYNSFTSWQQLVLQNLLAQTKHLQNYKSRKKYLHQYRDKQMAKNVEWLATQKYAKDKIIIWAHNGHIAKTYAYNNYATTDEVYYMMGDHLAKKSIIANELYVLGFTSYKGNIKWANGNNLAFKAKKPAKKSLENWVPSDYDFAFINFLPFNETNGTNPQAFSMKGSVINSGNNHMPYTTNWSKIFDGVFFIRNMYGCNTK
jgi:erythromycin esterase